MRSTRSQSVKKETPEVPAMRGSIRKAAPIATIVMKSVRPVIPTEPAEKRKLEEDLAVMRCENLMRIPWSCQNEALVREIMEGSEPVEFAKTVRARPKTWNQVDIGTAFKVPRDGDLMLPRGDNRLGPYFKGKIDTKEGWSLDQCTDKDLRRVLDFLNPIFHPEKPRKLTVRLGSTFAAALYQKVEINWASLLLDVMQRQVNNITGRKGVSLSPYLFQFYAAERVLTRAERTMLSVKETHLKYGISSAEPEEEDDSSEEECEEVKMETPKRRRLTKQYEGDQEPVGGTPDQPVAQKRYQLVSEETKQAFSTVRSELYELERKMAVMESGILHLTGLTGSTATTLIPKVEELVAGSANKKKVEQLEAKVKTLEKELAKERQDNDLLEKQIQQAQELSVLSRDIHNKVDAYTERVKALCKKEASQLVEEELEQKYLFKKPETMDLGVVVDIMVDYTERVRDIQEDIQITSSKLEEWSQLFKDTIPSPPAHGPVVQNYGDFFRDTPEDLRTTEPDDFSTLMTRFTPTGCQPGSSSDRFPVETGGPSSPPKQQQESSQTSPQVVSGSPIVKIV
jgi:hypothetical protein